MSKRKRRNSRQKERHSLDDKDNKRRKKKTNSSNRKSGSYSSKSEIRTKGKKTTHKDRKRQATPTNRMTVVFDLLFVLMIIFMLGGAAIFAVSQKEDKSFYGYRFYDVLTNSMVKTKEGQKGNFSAGDMVVVKVEEADKIQVGDIITFVPNKKALDTHLTHRVIEKKPQKAKTETNDKGESKTMDSYPVFITQGDANNLADPPVTGDLVIGVVKFSIPKAGSLIKFVRSNLIAVLVFILSFFGLLFVIRGYFAPDQQEN